MLDFKNRVCYTFLCEMNGAGENNMIILFMLGLSCLAIAGLKCFETMAASTVIYAVVGVVCIVAYLVNLIRKKMEG